VPAPVGTEHSELVAIGDLDQERVAAPADHLPDMLQ
jgi:hypothetical protein